MLSMKDFEDYFKRLDVGALQPSIDLVEILQQKHIAEFCFNNLAVLLGRPISLDSRTIIEKMVLNNQGGYCFEQNKLMHDALKVLGFDVRCLIARVKLGEGGDSPRTHRITLLEWNGVQYLVDVGFGLHSPRRPIKIKEGFSSRQSGVTYSVVVNESQEWQLELVTDKGATALYAFNLSDYTEADCEMGHFYASKHPEAVFVNNLVLSRTLVDVTLSLRNNEYHRIGLTQTEVIPIEDHLQLQGIIQQDFSIELSDEESQRLYLIAAAKKA